MRTTFDLSPLFRSTVGFDRLIDVLDQVHGVFPSGMQGDAQRPHFEPLRAGLCRRLIDARARGCHGGRP